MTQHHWKVDACDCHKWKSNATDRKMSTGMIIGCNISLLVNDMKFQLHKARATTIRFWTEAWLSTKITHKATVLWLPSHLQKDYPRHKEAIFAIYSVVLVLFRCFIFF